MEKISTALSAIIDGNPFLQEGLRHRLLNLSQVARFLQPQIEARTKKSVQPSAILMGLSRLQRRPARRHELVDFRVQNMTIHSDLAVTTFHKSPGVHRGMSVFYGRVQKRGGYITITEGMNEITAIFGRGDLKDLKETLSEQPLRQHLSVASIGLKFDERYLRVPGFLYLVLQALYFQQINIVELASTATELMIYLDEQDLRLAFDTLYYRFGGRR